MKDAFPFSAVVGQDEARLALLLAAVDPSIGGVLLRGEKGSAKTTLARGLASLLPDGAPFVELPVGATEDRVLGSLDLRAALEGGATDRFRPGLLAAAHGGVLYVDEVNLLPDHLVDALLDAAASGVHRVERDGVSHEHPARFVLLGSMNPEEGELRPQLLDRFGLTVDVRTPRDPALRAEAVRRRLAHDTGRTPTGGDEALRWRLAAARPATLPDHVVTFAAHLAVSVGAESLRADLVLCRAAAALAGWDGRTEAEEDDIARVAPLALPHRRRRRPFDPPSLSPDELADALAQARANHDAAPPTGDDVHLPSDPPADPTPLDPTSPAPPPTDPPSPAPGAGQSPTDPTSSNPTARQSPSNTTSSGRTAWQSPSDPTSSDPNAGRPAADPTSSDPNAGRPAADRVSSGPEGHRPPSDPTSVDPNAGRSPLDPAPSDRMPPGDGTRGRDSRPGSPGHDARQPDSGAPSRRRPEGAGQGAGPDAPAMRLPEGPSWQDLGGGAAVEIGSAPVLGIDAERRPMVEGRGRVVGHQAPGGDGPEGVAVLPTVRAALQRRLTTPGGPVLSPDDVRVPRRAERQARTVVLCVDASGSMGTRARVEAATGTVVSLLADAYLQRDQVALVAFRGDAAVEVLPATGSVELARARLADLPTGGPTPLAEGIATGLAVARRAEAKGSRPLLVMLTDGRATGVPGALDAARDAAQAVAAAGVDAVVLDAEDDAPNALGLARELAGLMGARYTRLTSVTATTIESALRPTLRP